MAVNFQRRILKNGITLLFEKRGLPVVSIGFAVRHGGVNESAAEKGISHFIEHLLYEGTKKRTSKQISSLIEKNGGVFNGFTDETITAFWCKIPSKKIDIALDVLSDMLKNSLFSPEHVKKERNIIFEEIKTRRDNPVQYVFDEIQGLLYGKPLGIPLIGTYETMNSIDRKKIIRKFREAYASSNLILSVVGDADFDKITRFAETAFKKKKTRIKSPKIILKNESKEERRKGIDQANLILAFHSPKSKDKKVYAAKLLMVIMATGLSSRLFYELRTRRDIAYSIHGDLAANKDFSYSYVFAGTGKNKVHEVKKIILNEFRKVAKSLTEKELNDAKQQVIGNYYISMENSESQMHQLLLSEADGNAREFYEFEKKIREVKLKDVKRLAKIKKYSFLALVPE